VLGNGWLGMLGYGVRSIDGSCSVRLFSSVRVLGRSCNDGRSGSSWSSVRVFNGFVDNRVNLARRLLGCGSGRRVVSQVLLVVGGSRLVGVVGVVGGFDELDGVVGHVV
jgi:hypothetical protein